jgi:TonB family protein
MKTKTIATTLLLAVALAGGPLEAAAAAPSLTVLLAGEPEAATINQHILNGAYDLAASAARKLLTEEGSQHPAYAFALLALAGAGGGQDAGGVGCRWQVAQLLDPRLESVDLSAYGVAGDILARRGLDSAARVAIRATEPGVVRPKLEAAVRPQYTAAARQARLQGMSVIEAVIGEDGSVRRPRVVKGMPMGLDATALDAVCDERFSPATKDGYPVAVDYVLTVVYHME